MRKFLVFAGIAALAVAISGCVTVQKVVRERVDQDVSGNKGYIKGQASNEPSAEKNKTREYIDVRVEIPTWGELQGEAVQKPTQARVESAATEEETYTPQEEIEPQQVAPVESVEPILYKVKDGDSLGKIAKKFYGKTSKWTLIYEANKERIKDPENIRPGIELVIPGVQEKESKYIK